MNADEKACTEEAAMRYSDGPFGGSASAVSPEGCCDRLKNEATVRAYTPVVADSRLRVFAAEVDVSLGRPPRTDATIYYQIAADSSVDAQLIACQMAACHPRVVMPVASRLVSS